MEKETVGLKKYIRVVDNFLTPKQCSAIIRTFKDSLFVDTRVVRADGSQEVDRKDRNVDEYGFQLHKSHTETHWQRYLTNKVAKAGGQYARDFRTYIHLSTVSGISLLSYPEGGFYNTHVDSCQHHFRELSFVIMLNDDYEGGSLKFYEEREEMMEVTKKAGRLILFPSNSLWPHHATPVKKGRRFVIVTWMY